MLQTPCPLLGLWANAFLFYINAACTVKTVHPHVSDSFTLHSSACVGWAPCHVWVLWAPFTRLLFLNRDITYSTKKNGTRAWETRASVLNLEWTCEVWMDPKLSTDVIHSPRRASRIYSQNVSPLFLPEIFSLLKGRQKNVHLWGKLEPHFLPLWGVSLLPTKR